MGKLIVGTVASLLLVGHWQLLSAGEATVATTSASASQPAAIPEFTGGKAFSAAKGKWRFCRGYHPIVRAISPNYVWLQASGELSQIDIRTGDVRVFTPLDGLPLDRTVTILAVSQGDRAILNPGNKKLYLWAPKEGWSVLPPLPGNAPVGDVSFDLDETPLAVSRNVPTGPEPMASDLYEFVKGAWQVRRKIPPSDQVIPMKEGLALRLSGTNFKSREVVFLRSDDADASKMTPVGAAQGDLPQRCVWLGGRLFEFFPTTLINFLGMPPVRELTLDGYKIVIRRGATGTAPSVPAATQEGIEASQFGLDFRAGRFVPVRMPLIVRHEDPNKRPYYRVEQFGDEACDFMLPFPAGMLVRDKGGRIWGGLCSWEGGQLTNHGQMALPVDSLHQVADPAYCRLDMQEGFSRIRPESAKRLEPYDPATRRGWTHASTDAGLASQYVEVDEQGVCKVLREVPTRPLVLNPQIQLADGSWWGALGGGGAFRIGPDGKVTQYNTRTFGLWLSPKGNLILGGPTLHKYDSAKDQFDPCPDAWEDFAFRIGPYQLSAMPTLYGSNGVQLMQKVGGKWVNFKTPLHNNIPSMVGGSVRGQRVLLTFPGVGVLEYDGQRNRWIRLTDEFYYGVLDERGRRILVGLGHVLVYDGDPFESEHYQATGPTAEDEKLLQSLLKQLDADEPAKRAEASDALGKLAGKVLPSLELAATDERFSLEVRTRVQRVLADMPMRDRQAANMPVLLRQDCPLPGQPTTQPATSSRPESSGGTGMDVTGISHQ